jgi:H+/Cl- antiporter ClcA
LITSLCFILIAVALAFATLAVFPPRDYTGAPQFKIWAFCTYIFFCAIGLFAGLSARLGISSLERELK